jgi:16S rRNA (cytidine1402-2'-O)-methyltransferase
MNAKNQLGKLYLVPAPLDFGCDTLTPLTDVLPLATLQTAAKLQHWVCENAKSTRAYLKRVDANCPVKCIKKAIIQAARVLHLMRNPC